LVDRIDSPLAFRYLSASMSGRQLRDVGRYAPRLVMLLPLTLPRAVGAWNRPDAASKFSVNEQQPAEH
jgi:hypothetical protein